MVEEQKAQKPPETDRKARGCSPLAWLRRQLVSRWFADHFEHVVIVIIALVTVMAALVAFLQTWADGHAATYTRQSQALAMEAMGHDMSSRQRESYDFDLYTTWNEWDWRRIKAKEYSDAPLAEQAEQVTEMIVPLTPLLDRTKPYFNPETEYADVYAYHVNTNLITTTALLEQRTFAIETANAWNGKGDGYVTILTVIAVALFLYGLSTTISGVVRYLFAAAGTCLIVMSLLWAFVLTLSSVPTIPTGAIAEYARGQGLYYAAATDEDYQVAIDAFSAALALYPDYGNAYAARAAIRLDMGDYAAAADDYRQAIENGRGDQSVYWELGWVLYLQGDYEASLEASRQALAMKPDLVPTIMNVATTLLAKGETDAAMQEYERGLTIAADPASTTSMSWNHVYLLETLNDLDRLIAALDGQQGFAQEPDLSRIADRAALREAAVAARRRIQEGIVTIEATGSPRRMSTQASIAPLSFALYANQRGDLLGGGDTFARGLMSIVTDVAFENLSPGDILSRRVTRQWTDEAGWIEHLPTLRDDLAWDGAQSGTIQQELKSPWPGRRGMLPGIYNVEYYVNGYLLQTGSFVIPEEDAFIIGPLTFATEFASSGQPYGPDNLFPAGVTELHGQFNYSGVPAGTIVRGMWYRDGELYDQIKTNPLSGWGTYTFYIVDVPPGNYRLELYTADTELPVQSDVFQVVEAEAYLQAIGEEPDTAIFHRNLGEAFAYSEDYQQAITHYARAVDLEPDCARCYYQWGVALNALGNIDEAIQKLRVAVDLRPAEYDYRCDLGDVYYESGQDEAAVAEYRAAILAADPGYVYNHWGNALYSLGRYEESVRKYEEAIELKPGIATYYSNLAGSYGELQEYDKAEAAFAQAVDLNPTYDWYYNRWGDILYKQEKYAEATEKYERAAELDPTFSPYYSDLGNVYYSLGEYDKAIAAFEQATTLSPWRDADFNQWGDVLYEQEKYAEALEKYQQAAALQPDEGLYHFNMGWAHYQLGQNQSAIAEFELAAELAAAASNEALQQNAEIMLEELANP